MSLPIILEPNSSDPGSNPGTSAISVGLMTEQRGVATRLQPKGETDG